MACRMRFRRHSCLVSIEARLRYRRDSKVPRALSLSPCASPKINSRARFLLWLQMTSACVLPPISAPHRRSQSRRQIAAAPAWAAAARRLGRQTNRGCSLQWRTSPQRRRRSTHTPYSKSRHLLSCLGLVKLKAAKKNTCPTLATDSDVSSTTKMLLNHLNFQI